MEVDSMSACKKLKNSQVQDEEVVILQEDISQVNQEKEILVQETTYSIEQFSATIFPNEKVEARSSGQNNPKTIIVSHYKELNI